MVLERPADEKLELPAWIHSARFSISELRTRVKSEKLKASTVSEYARRAAKLVALRDSGTGVDIAHMVKRERYMWKAAGAWYFKNSCRDAMRNADRIWKASYTSEGQRWKAYRNAITEIHKTTKALDAWEALDFSKSVGEAWRKEMNHKKKPATDDELSRFFEIAGSSKYRLAFLVMEFAGVRPEEFGAGVRVEIAEQNGVAGVRFVIEGAKCGDKKGQAVRSVFIVPPTKAGQGVKTRYAELDRLVKESSGLVVKVEAGESMTAGQKLSRSFTDFSKKMGGTGPKLSAYSLRNRFSAQAKGSLGTLEEVAQVLGHQSTETQKHYGRRQRGGGAVSPVAVAVGAGVEYEPVRSYGRSRKPVIGSKTVNRVSGGVPPPRPRF